LIGQDKKGYSVPCPTPIVDNGNIFKGVVTQYIWLWKYGLSKENLF